jgi:hypothetical protein
LQKEDFEKRLLEAVDEALSSLGESSKQAIYFHLNRNFNIEREEIPYKIADFIGALEEVFGVGANFLEVLIMRRLHETVGGAFEWKESEEFTFTEYIAVAKRNFQERNKITIAAETVKCEEE